MMGTDDDYGPVSGGWGADCLTMFNPQDAYCTGTITTTFTWTHESGQTDDSDPPPESVIVTESASAEADAYTTPAGDVSASCSDGIGQTGTLDEWQDIEGGQDVGTNGEASCSGTRYHAISGADSLTFTCSPSASASSSDWYPAHTDVYYSAAVSPVTIQLTGTTLDSDGMDNILIGQLCSASLTGLPGGCAITYDWSVSGSIFQSWTVSTDTAQSYTTEVDGLGDATRANPSWYWNEIGKDTSVMRTVSCTATVTPPSGAGTPFTMSATKDVIVWIPAWSASGTGGNMQVNTPGPTGSGTDYWLWAAPISGAGLFGGMEWQATVTAPTTTTLFSDGSLELVQPIVPDISFTGLNIFGVLSNYTWSLNGEYGLDTFYPYAWKWSPPTYSNYFGYDGPGIDLTRYDALSAYVGDQFEDYLMYTPPGSHVQPVPLANFAWSTDGSADIPSPGGWPAWAGSAGTVTPSGSATNFLPDNSFPTWTQNSGNNPPSTGRF